MRCFITTAYELVVTLITLGLFVWAVGVLVRDFREDNLPTPCELDGFGICNEIRLRGAVETFKHHAQAVILTTEQHSAVKTLTISKEEEDLSVLTSEK